MPTACPTARTEPDPRPYWNSACGGCTAAQLARMGKDQRKRHQKEWIGYNSRWMVEIIISSLKRLLGEALRAVKTEYIMIEIATKIAVYNKTRDIMSKAVW